MGQTYRKTPKGMTEIETRQHRLAPRLRSLLILIDGRRTETDLRAMVPQQVDEGLAHLLEHGFVAAVDEAPIAPADPPGRPEPRARPTPPPSPPMASESFLAVRRDAVRELLDAAGPLAESLAMRMERARTREELRPQIELAAQFIRNFRGAPAAAAYLARFQAA